MSRRLVENITDIFDIEYLQNVQDNLGRVSKVETVLIGPDGYPLSEFTHPEAFCAMMHAGKGESLCVGMSRHIIEENRRNRETYIVSCPYSGLTMGSVPIFHEDEYLCSWLVCNVRMDEPDYALLERTCDKANIDKAKAFASVDNLPITSEKDLEHILDFLKITSRSLTDMLDVHETLQERDSALAESNEKLDRSLNTFNDFMNLLDGGAFLTDFHTREIIMSNDVFHSTVAVHGDGGQSSLLSLIPKDKLIDAYGETFEDPYIWEAYCEETKQWLNLASRAVRWIDDRLTIITTYMDITARKEEEERVSNLAFYDQQLGIPNGTKLQEDISRQTRKSLMICFDIKDFRQINSIYGRDAGDKLLGDIVRWINDQPEGNDVYRIFGGEFVILLSDHTVEEAMRFATSIYSRFDREWPIEDGSKQDTLFVGVHMGVIRTPEEIETYSSLVNLIEGVISFARREGNLSFLSEEAQQHLNELMQFDVDLKFCVLNDMQGFTLNYQPIADAITGQWVGVEALCRWNRPNYGSVPPNIFIREAERLRLIDSISEWVLEESVRQVKEWGLDASPTFFLDVNLSPLQLHDKNLTSKVVDILQKYDYPAAQLSLEITESAEFTFDGARMDVLRDLNKTGVSLALDDFGSGYATFANLRNLPVETLKTDRSFVEGIEHDIFLEQVIRSIIDLANAAGIKTIAEGVETESQTQLLIKNGVELIQGYYFSKPLTKEVLSQELSRFTQ